MDQVKEMVWRIWERGQSDPQYAQMLIQCRELEKAYDAVLQTLPYAQQDIICDFVSHCEAMSWRMLEFACMELDKKS